MATFYSVSFSKPIPVWFGKIKTDFARRRFQTKFRLVWKILMTIVNVLKIPNQIQFGLEKSLTKYSVEYCSEVSVEHSCPEDSKHSSFISVQHSSEYSVAHSCVISSWQTSRSTLLQCSEDSTEHLRPGTSWHCAAAFVELKCALLKRFLRVQNISILYLDTLRGSSTHRSWSSHGYDHNSV